MPGAQEKGNKRLCLNQWCFSSISQQRENMLYKVVFLWPFYPQRFVPPRRGLGYIHLCFPCQARMSVTLLIQTVLLDSKILDDRAYFAEGFTERLGGGGTSHTPLSLFSSPVACPGAAQVSGIFSLLLTHTSTQKSSLPHLCPGKISWCPQIPPYTAKQKSPSDLNSGHLLFFKHTP